jgi:hypothetical protein
MEDKTDKTDQYRIVRNDGVLYMTCDWDTALRLMRQLNERYEGIYTYRIEQVGA